MLQQTETKKSKSKTTKTVIRRVDMIANELATEHHAIVQLLVTLYKKAYLVEQAYMDECVSDAIFRTEYPLFRNYIQKKIPLFDLLDYYSFKPLIALDSYDLLDYLDNGAFRVLRAKLVKLSTGVVHPMTATVIGDISYDKVNTEVDIRNLLYKHNIPERKPKPGKNLPLNKKGFTDAQYKKMTKNDLIVLCKKLHKKLAKLESK